MPQVEDRLERFIDVIKYHLHGGEMNWVGLRLDLKRIIAEHAPEPQWIAIKTDEDRPPCGQVVIVVIDGYVQHMPCVRDGDEWNWLDAELWDYVPARKITHWMPLPKAPGGK